jgi:hypothetical protein
MSAATKARKKALERLVDTAVAALGKSDSGADTRRPEIRSMIDQLSRHPELVDSWIDGTLRDLPEDDFGFGAFADMQVPDRPGAAKPTKEKKSSRADDAPVGRNEEPASKPRPDGAARAARAEEARAARKGVAAAARELAVAERGVHAAEEAVRKAEKELQAAEHARAAAEKRHRQATARLEASRSQ